MIKLQLVNRPMKIRPHL